MSYRNKKTGEIISDQEYIQKIGVSTNDRTAKIEQLRTEAQQAQTEAGKGVGRRFLSELPSQAYQTIAGNVPRFLTSAVAAPIDIVRGALGKEPMQGTAKFPGLEPFQTFQAGAASKFSQLAQGQGSDIGAGFKMAGELAKTPLAGVETATAFNLLQKTPEALMATGRFFTKTANKKAVKDALEVILPKKMTPTELEKRIKRPGEIAYKGYITKTAQPVASKFENQVADTVKGIVNSKYTPDKNIILIKNKIGDISENFVRPNLEAYPGIFNENTILSKLNAIETPTLLKSNTTLNNTYKVVTDAAMDTIKGQPHTMSGLWKARQVLDDIADEARLLEPTQRSVAAKAIRDVRNVMNQFIIDTIPNGEKLYGEPMKQMSRMYKAIDMIADNTPSQIIAHPALRTSLRWFGKVVKYTAAGIGIGWLAKRFGSGGWDAGL